MRNYYWQRRTQKTAKSKFQAFETETISRDMIKNAPYNPRIMDEKAMKKEGFRKITSEKVGIRKAYKKKDKPVVRVKNI